MKEQVKPTTENRLVKEPSPIKKPPTLKSSFEEPNDNDRNHNQKNAYYNLKTAIWLQNTVLPDIVTLIKDYPDKELVLKDDTISARTQQIKILMGLKYLAEGIEDKEVRKHMAVLRDSVVVVTPNPKVNELKIMTRERHNEVRRKRVTEQNKARASKNLAANKKSAFIDTTTSRAKPRTLDDIRETLDNFLRAKRHNDRAFIKFEHLVIDDNELAELRQFEPLGLSLNYDTSNLNLVLVWDEPQV